MVKLKNLIVPISKSSISCVSIPRKCILTKKTVGNFYNFSLTIKSHWGLIPYKIFMVRMDIYIQSQPNTKYDSFEHLKKFVRHILTGFLSTMHWSGSKSNLKIIKPNSTDFKVVFWNFQSEKEFMDLAIYRWNTHSMKS